MSCHLQGKHHLSQTLFSELRLTTARTKANNVHSQSDKFDAFQIMLFDIGKEIQTTSMHKCLHCRLQHKCKLDEPVRRNSYVKASLKQSMNSTTSNLIQSSTQKQYRMDNRKPPHLQNQSYKEGNKFETACTSPYKQHHQHRNNASHGTQQQCHHQLKYRQHNY